MANGATPGAHRTSTEILTRRGGVFWGVVLLLIGMLWMLDTVGVIRLAPNFGAILLPLLLVIAGLYLLVGKLLR